MATLPQNLRSLLEYRMRSVSIGHVALQHALSWNETPDIDIRFNGVQVIEGKATAFTNAAIEAGIIHSRALLEFLGLKGKSQTELQERRGKSADDHAIELHGLSKVTVHKAVSSYPGPNQEAEAALAYVIYLANKGLAHSTTSFTQHDEGVKLIEIAFRGVPVLVVNNVYVPLGITPPNYAIVGRKRAV